MDPPRDHAHRCAVNGQVVVPVGGKLKVPPPLRVQLGDVPRGGQGTLPRAAQPEAGDRTGPHFYPARTSPVARRPRQFHADRCPARPRRESQPRTSAAECVQDSNEVIGRPHEPLHQLVRLRRVPEVAVALTDNAAGLLLRLLPPLDGVARVSLATRAGLPVPWLLNTPQQRRTWASPSAAWE